MKVCERKKIASGGRGTRASTTVCDNCECEACDRGSWNYEECRIIEVNEVLFQYCGIVKHFKFLK